MSTEGLDIVVPAVTGGGRGGVKKAPAAKKKPVKKAVGKKTGARRKVASKAKPTVSGRQRGIM